MFESHNYPSDLLGKQNISGDHMASLLTLSLLLITQEAFVYSWDQDQSAQNVHYDLWFTQFTLLF